MEILTKSEIKKELQNINKPLLYEGAQFPLQIITDREFEILIYYLFEIEKIEKSKEYDSINLMSGVGEKGRDCVLYKNGEVYGIIQCKHSAIDQKYDKTSVIKEIIKFILNCINSPELINDLENLTYYLVHSKGFNESAQVLLEDFNNNIFKEDYKKHTNEVIKQYRKLVFIYNNELEDQLFKFFRKITIIKLEHVDITRMLSPNPEIVDMFFQIKKVEMVLPDIPRDYENKEMDDEKKAVFSNKKFVEKLKEISLPQNSQNQALDDYWKMAETLIIINQKDFYETDIFTCYKNDLSSHYNFCYENKCEDILLIENEHDIIKKSRIFYRSVMNNPPIDIINYKNNRPFFQRGMFHSLVEENKIKTWKLKHYSEEEEE